jgi:uncharacterized protein
MLSFTGDNDQPLAKQFADFIRDENFPCVGAKSALARGSLEIVVARDVMSAYDDLRIYAGIYNLAERYVADPYLFQSFAVIFEGPLDLSEREFETALWARLQSLSEKDAFHGQPYDRSVSADPDDPHFSLSFGSQAFFVVGLHPHSSRPARAFPAPVLVFNLHDQFEQLRKQGKYETLRSSILKRDMALAGSVNPMLSRHGECSEARQYSGRKVSENWQCPYDPERRTRFDAQNYSTPFGNSISPSERPNTDCERSRRRAGRGPRRV